MAYFLLDGARLEVQLEEAKKLAGSDNFRCLYKGNLAEQLANVAPYLFVSRPQNLVEWLFAEGWGEAWGIYVLSNELPTIVYDHFRKFLVVKDTRARNLYFRFYDPRVLKPFLQQCTSAELIDFFGPVRYFLMEDTDADYGISFWLDRGKLQVTRHPKEEAKKNYLAYLK